MWSVVAKEYDVSYWMWSRRERGPCLDFAQVLGTREGDRRVDVCCDRLQRDIPHDWRKYNRGCELFVTCILVQKARGRKPKRRDEIPPLFCVFQQYSCPFVFRADTFVLLERQFSLFAFSFAQPLLCATFIRIYFCVFSPFLFQVQSSEVWCFRTSVESLSVLFSQSLRLIIVAWLKSLGSVVLTASLLHAHLIATPRYAYSPPRSRATARAQRVTNTPSGSGAGA